MSFKLGDKVKVKSSKELIKMTGGGPYPVELSSGLMFIAPMISFAGSSGLVTEIVNPGEERRGEKNQLNEPSYRIGAVEVFWTADMLERCK